MLSVGDHPAGSVKVSGAPVNTTAPDADVSRLALLYHQNTTPLIGGFVVA